MSVVVGKINSYDKNEERPIKTNVRSYNQYDCQAYKDIRKKKEEIRRQLKIEINRREK